MPLTDRLLWVDVETFGLDYKNDFILELGFMITNLDLDVIDINSWLIWESGTYERRLEKLRADAKNWEALELGEFNAADYVLNMHTKNNLFEEAWANGVDRKLIGDEIHHWLVEGHGFSRQDPICGSSVHADRGWIENQMPHAIDFLSYRNIDVSSLKELASGYNPSVLPEKKGREIHRVIPDLEDTIAEFNGYLSEFLVVNR